MRTLRDGGATVVDVRPVADYAAGHIPASVSIPLRNAVRDLAGLARRPPAPRSSCVRDPDQDPEEIAWQALKIGYERLVGELDGGMPAWVTAGQPVAATDLVSPAQIRRLAGARRAAGQRVPRRAPPRREACRTRVRSPSAADRLPDDPTVVMCGHGERAAGAASLLERAGHHDLAILVGGPDDWAAATGQPLNVD